jgi:hypothetical protein
VWETSAELGVLEGRAVAGFVNVAERVGIVDADDDVVGLIERGMSALLVLPIDPLAPIIVNRELPHHDGRPQGLVASNRATVPAGDAPGAVAPWARASARPAPDRPHGPVLGGRGCLVGQPLEVAEHDRGAVLPGKAVDLLVEHRAEFVEPSVPGRSGDVCRLGHPVFVGLPPGRGDLRLGRDPVGHAVEPGPERFPEPERVSLAHQHEERGLEGVVDLVRVALHTRRTIGP